MEQGPLFHCHDCERKKPIYEIKLHKKDKKYGKKGEPTSTCIPCAANRQERCQNKKWQWDEEGPDPSEGPAEPSPITSIEQFAALLHQQAIMGDINCFAC